MKFIPIHLSSSEDTIEFVTFLMDLDADFIFRDDLTVEAMDVGSLTVYQFKTSKEIIAMLKSFVKHSSSLRKSVASGKYHWKCC